MKFSPWVIPSLLLSTAVFHPQTTFAAPALAAPKLAVPAHKFSIGDKDFLLDDKPFQIRCGEIHFARVPRALWRDRLKRCRAMGLNTVCAYLFWNFHEFQAGKYNWKGQADAAEFCRLAQEEGLHVILRPGPYACAEWDGGGLPWWLLKNPTIKMRSQDPAFMSASRAWLKEVGRVLGPQQISKGGPILMVQVENEYGSYGNDAEYMGQLRQATLDGGFDVPLFACNPTGDLRKGLRSDLFQVVNFGNNPEAGFKALRAVQPTGPLMCGEFYPGWFDTWGAPHHNGSAQNYLRDLETMLKMGASFSIYMAHGGTTPGLWPGADRPFKPDTNSYDYDAPIRENGDLGEKFQLTRALMSKYLQPGEVLPAPPQNIPAKGFAAFKLTEKALVLENLPKPIGNGAPPSMETVNQGHGCLLYRTTIPAGPATVLQADAVHDFAWVSLNGQPIGEMDRRNRRASVQLPARTAAMRLDILVEAMGHVNFGIEVHDRKGLIGNVSLGAAPAMLLTNWQAFPMPLDEPMLKGLKWKKMTSTRMSTGATISRAKPNSQRAALLKSVSQSHHKGITFYSDAVSGAEKFVIKTTVRTPDEFAQFIHNLRDNSSDFGGSLISGRPNISSQKAADTPQTNAPLTYPRAVETRGTLLKPIEVKSASNAVSTQAGTQGAAFYRGYFSVERPADTFLDLRNLGKGVLWINGHCLSRFWNIGPTQTAYLPATYMRSGRNEVVVFDLVGPAKLEISGLNKPILDELRPELDFNFKPLVKGQLKIAGVAPAWSASFPEGPEVQEVRFPQAIEGRQFVIEALSSQDGKPFTTIAELDLLDANGQSIPHTNWSIPYVDSEESQGEDGAASNALDGQTNSFWHTQWSGAQPNLPHQFALDLGGLKKIGGFRYTPRPGNGVAGRIKDYKVYIGSELALAPTK